MRIGVNIPNELMNRVKEIRPPVNVSQVCREALEKRAMTHDRVLSQVASDGVDDQVFRLAESLPNPLIEPDWETYALQDARGWVESVDDYLWERFIYQHDFLGREGREPTVMIDSWSRGNGSKGFMDRIYEHYDWLVEQHGAQFKSGYDGSNPHEKARKLYARAWLGYVLEVRRRLEQHRKDQYEKLKAEREKYRQSLPDVELPPQLV